MLKHTQIQRLMFLFAIAGLFAVTADFACLEDVCAELKTGEFRTMDEVVRNRVETLDEAVLRSGIALTDDQRATLKRDGQLFGVVKLDRPVKHPNGVVELPKGWLPAIPEGHPWSASIRPGDDAFYSWFEERILRARLFDPTNAEHKKFAEAYIKKANSSAPAFSGYTYANRTECVKKKNDAKGSKGPTDAAEDAAEQL